MYPARQCIFDLQALQVVTGAGIRRRLGALPIIGRLRRRAERQRLIARGLRSRTALRAISDRTRRIERGDILCFVTLRGERARLPWFLSYYRAMGVRHFLIVDNASQDGSGDYLRAQPDVAVVDRSRLQGCALRDGLDQLAVAEAWPGALVPDRRSRRVPGLSAS